MRACGVSPTWLVMTAAPDDRAVVQREGNPGVGGTGELSITCDRGCAGGGKMSAFPGGPV
ncbi:hypothetical protein GCM10010340_24910 [Streptomyces griseoloalbus]|nr:hypothetical protein GCM10010340_24910 [Streptomyces albaduncus]